MNPEERATDTPASTNGQVSPAGLAAAGLADVQAHTPILDLSGIRAAYGRIQVLHGVSLKVMPGETVVLLGANGAGKTTTISVIAGQMAPTGGDYLLAGRRVNGAAPEALARIGVCTIPEGRGVFPNLTVTENLLMASYGGRSADSIRTKAFELFPRLAERRDQPAGTMSGGEQQMLALARGLVTDPALLILDEISMGLAPIIVDELYTYVERIARSGVSVIVVEQFAHRALAIADRAYIMAHGRVTSEGRPEEMEAELQASYLGAGN
jgi:branched-chain amino acid transport system ATP-binding protein